MQPHTWPQKNMFLLSVEDHSRRHGIFVSPCVIVDGLGDRWEPSNVMALSSLQIVCKYTNIFDIFFSPRMVGDWPKI